MLDNYKHNISVITRFSDTDIMGHVNNARYVTYLEEARIQYTRDVLGWGGEAREIGMILAKTVIDYLLPLHVGDLVKVYTRCSRLGRKSFDMSYVIVLAPDDNLVATASTTMVAYDYTREASIMVSEDWRTRIAAYEKVAPTT